MNEKYHLLRTREMEKKHAEYRKLSKTNPLPNLSFKKSIDEFKYWRIVKNKFPQDAIATTANMLIPKRVFATSDEINKEELEELNYLLTNKLVEKYDAIFVNLKSERSVKGHYHIHLWKLRKFNPDEMIEN